LGQPKTLLIEFGLNIHSKSLLIIIINKDFILRGQ